MDITRAVIMTRVWMNISEKYVQEREIMGKNQVRGNLVKYDYHASAVGFFSNFYIFFYKNYNLC